MKDLGDQFAHTTHLSDMKKASLFQASLEETIFGVAFVTVFALVQLPYEKIDSNPIPTIIFKNKPSFFHAFLLSLNFAFTGAVMAISLRKRHPMIASHCRRLAIVSIATAVGILMWLVLPSTFGWVASI